VKKILEHRTLHRGTLQGGFRQLGMQLMRALSIVGDWENARKCLSHRRGISRRRTIARRVGLDEGFPAHRLA